MKMENEIRLFLGKNSRELYRILKAMTNDLIFLFLTLSSILEIISLDEKRRGEEVYTIYDDGGVVVLVRKKKARYRCVMFI